MQYSDYFEIKERTPTKEKFSCLKDNRPENLLEFIRDVHFNFDNNMLSNDWIYSIIHEAFLDIGKYYDNEIDIDVILNEIEPDIYNYDLIEWAKNSFAMDIINEIIVEYQAKDFIVLIQTAQIQAKCTIYQLVYDFIQRPIY